MKEYFAWTEEEIEICKKHYATLGAAGIISKGLITRRTRLAIKTQCCEVLKLRCNHRKGQRLFANSETHPGHVQYAWVSSIFAVGAA